MALVKYFSKTDSSKNPRMTPGTAPTSNAFRSIRSLSLTGKAKTKGQTEGKTKGSDGRYKRQLVFYALLLSLQKDQNFHCVVGRLSYIEPDKKGNLREEEFVITETEINDLKKLYYRSN